MFYMNLFISVPFDLTHTASANERCHTLSVFGAGGQRLGKRALSYTLSVWGGQRFAHYFSCRHRLETECCAVAVSGDNKSSFNSFRPTMLNSSRPTMLTTPRPKTLTSPSTNDADFSWTKDAQFPSTANFKFVMY